MKPTQGIVELAADLRALVKAIEMIKAPVTRNNYGRYMEIISYTSKDAVTAGIVAAALIEAGANKQGVNDALRVTFPGA